MVWRPIDLHNGRQCEEVQNLTGRLFHFPEQTIKKQRQKTSGKTWTCGNTAQRNMHLA